MPILISDTPSIDVGDAVAYNTDHDLTPFLCQSTLECVDPRTQEGALWVAQHQTLLALTVDGKLGPATRGALVQRYGDLAQEPVALHPLPVWQRRWSYDHAYDPGNVGWPVHEESWIEFTNGDRWEHGMLRLVSGFRPKYNVVSRYPRSVISLDTVSVGIAHYWARTAPDHLSGLVKALPDLAEKAWGCKAREMRDQDWTMRQFSPQKGKHPWAARLNWFVAGWRWIMQHDVAIAWHAQQWLDKYVGRGKRLVSRFGWENHLDDEIGGQILAACTRLENSGAATRRVRNGRDAQDDVLTPDDRNLPKPLRVLKATYLLDRDHGGYEKPGRWAKISSWAQFQGPAPKHPTLDVETC